MRKVSKDNPLPLHYQIKEILQEMIEDEELKPGDMIPTERELCEFHGVSRMTVNKAIMSLVNQGLVHREQGKGTYVSKVKPRKEISNLKGFTEEMKDNGVKTDTEILSFEIKKTTKQIKDALELENGNSKVIEINRLRRIEDEPVAIEKVWLPYNLFKDMTEEMIAGKSLYNLFRNRYSYKLEKAKQTIEPMLIDEYEAKLLNQKENALALVFNRVTFMADNIPVEYTKAIYRSDIYKYEVVLR